MAAFHIMVRGFHVYQHTWTPVVGETLLCVRERGNQEDPYAVSVNKEREVVGHVPRLISAFCFSFIRRGGTITCIITGTKRYSRDLVQGGVEVPCVFMCSGEACDILKAKKLLNGVFSHPDLPTSIRLLTENAGSSLVSSPHSTMDNTSSTSSEASIIIEAGAEDSNHSVDVCNTMWVTFDHFFLSLMDKDTVINGLELNDMHMTYAQKLLHHQFPHIVGLQASLFQHQKPSCPLELQIVHDHNHSHWIVCSTVNSLPWQVDVYDTLFKRLDETTTSIVRHLFGEELEINMVPVQKQVGGSDCGPFAIAIATSLAFDVPPENRRFNQQSMRHHIIDCFEKKCMVIFP